MVKRGRPEASLPLDASWRPSSQTPPPVRDKTCALEVCPKPPVLGSSCIVPTIGGAGLIGSRLESLEADVIVSVGSGAGLLEWLLAGRFPSVVCVDVFYRPGEGGRIDEWVIPQLRPLPASTHRNIALEASGRQLWPQVPSRVDQQGSETWARTPKAVSTSGRNRPHRARIGMESGRSAVFDVAEQIPSRPGRRNSAGIGLSELGLG